MKEDAGLFRAFVDQGAHLAPSRETSGSFRGSTLSDQNNSLFGQAEFFEVDDIDPKVAAALGLAAGILVGGAAVYTAFQNGDVQRWWGDAVVPSVKTKWSRIARKGPDGEEGGPAALTERRSGEGESEEPGGTDITTGGVGSLR